MATHHQQRDTAVPVKIWRDEVRVCLITTEMAGVGSYGGFGVLTRDIASGLAERGLEIYVVMPQRSGQRPIEIVDGITVVSYPSGAYYNGLKKAMPFVGVFKMIDADIYHSQEPTIGTRLAQIAQPHAKHVVTFQDPRTIEDWRKQWVPRRPSMLWELKFRIKFQREVVPAARRAVARYCQAKYIIEKAVRIYRLTERPGFLPNPMRMPDSETVKASESTVCFLGRWDEIKRPELFLELAAKFPRVKFVAMGACLNNKERDDTIRRRCVELENVEAPGWLDAPERNRVLARAWILVNTSTKECLPVSYLEACVHKCAILSHRNADDFASKFGYWAQKGDIEDFACGLEFLLENDRWRELGEFGYEYVKNTHEFNRVIDQHIGVYEKVLSQ